jgi:FlaA1/EpsC-like NDP-sugar epimerase
VIGVGVSIVSDLRVQIIKLKLKKLVLVEMDEYALYSSHSQLERIWDILDNLNVVHMLPLLAPVQDKARML